MDSLNLRVDASIALAPAPDLVAVSEDGSRAFVSHSTSSANVGTLSVVDLATGTAREVPVPGGRTKWLSVTPNAAFVYVVAGADRLHKVNAATLQFEHSLRADGHVVALASGVSPDLAFERAGAARVVVRAQNVSGIGGTDVEVRMTVEMGGLAVASLTHDLVLARDSSVVVGADGLAECWTEQGGEVIAWFQVPDACGATCDRVRVNLRAIDPTLGLPATGLVYRCRVHLAALDWENDFVVAVAGPVARGADGASAPTFGINAIVHAEYALPATPTPTPTATAVPTRSGTPARIEIGRVRERSGGIAVVDVVLRTNGWDVAGLQHDMYYGPEDFAVPTPRCSPNFSIEKEGTSFARRGWNGFRVVVLSFDDVDPIPDGSVLYSCHFSYAGESELIGFNAIASSPQGTRVPVEIIDGWIHDEPWPTETPWPAAPTAAPGMSATPSAPAPTPTSDTVAEGSGTSPSGCHVIPARDAAAGWLMLASLSTWFVGVRCRSWREWPANRVW